MRGNSRLTAVALATCLVLCWVPAIARAQNNDVPASKDYIVDTAHVLQPEAIRSIDGWLQELQEKTGAQVKLLTVRTTGGEDFFTFVERQFEHWKLGQAGKNNGALIALAVDDHKVRVHTGYGLEPVLPDSWCGSLSREAAATFFKAGKYSDGLVYMVKAVAFQIAQDQGVKLTGIPEQVHHPAGQQGLSPNAVLALMLIGIFALYFLSRSNSGGGPGGRGGRGIWQPWMGSRGWGNSYGNSSYGNSGSFGGGGWGGSFGGGGGGGGTFGGGSFGGGGSTGGGGGGASW